MIAIFIIVAAILTALLLGSVFIAISGENPIKIYIQLVKGAYGSNVLRGITISKMATLLLVGLGVGIAFKCNLVNIGGDGQLLMGALGSALAALYLDNIPTMLHILLCFLMGFLFGAVWGMIAGLLKAYKGMSEMITTIMLNYIATWFVSFLVNGVLKDTESNYPYPWTPEVPDRLKLASLFGTRVNIGILIALAIAVAIFWYLRYTASGYELRASGKNAEAASFVGINVNRSVVKAMALSGGLAGMAGTVELLGSQFRVSDTFANGYGFDGVAVAFLANSNPIGTIFSSFFFSSLQCGAENVARITNVSSSVSGIIQGLIILLILIGTSKKLNRVMKGVLERRKKQHE
ncbi:MAG: ABC transporter permease [Lachnospiraceae bacterium]|nr:ABC transporter permease [Lachnospiraceae bacterium]